MGLIGHMSSCSMAFAMYFHVHYDYRDNEINLNIPGLFDLKNFLSYKQNIYKCSITFSDIIEQILSTKKNRLKLHHSTLNNHYYNSPVLTPEPMTLGQCNYNHASSLARLY